MTDEQTLSLDSISAIAENLTDGFAVWDCATPDPILVYVNPATTWQTGVSIENLVGKRMSEAFPYFMQTMPGQATVHQEKYDISSFSYGDDNVPLSVFSVTVQPLGGGLVAVIYIQAATEERVDYILNVVAKAKAVLSNG